MERISDLNKKWWYRLIKVVFVVFFIGIIMAGVMIVAGEYSPSFDNKASYALCKDGNKVGLDENSIYLNSSFISNTNDKTIKKRCGTTFTLEEIKKRVPSYELVSVYKSRNWLAVVGFSLLLVFITIIVAEIIRRIFYYIILGKIKPEK